MRVVSAEEYLKKTEESEKEEPKKEESQNDEKPSFNEILVKELGNEFYGVSFFTSLGILKKSCGFCDTAKFFWKIAEDTMEIEKKIKKFLLYEEYPFTIPQIDAAKVNKEENFFKQALDYENNRIEHLCELKPECNFTKSIIGKLLKMHKEIQHLLSLAYKISQSSEDKLLIQQAVYKLI